MPETMTATCRRAQRTGTPCNDCVICLSSLPNGKTCGDCAHAKRCAAFGFTDSLDNTYCSFIPSRALIRDAELPSVGDAARAGEGEQ